MAGTKGVVFWVQPAGLFACLWALARPELRLVSALLAECDEEWMTGKIYLHLKN